MYNSKESVKARYTRMETKREPFLRRARRVSELTLPFLITPQGHEGSSDLPTPYQSLGARGITNLSAKLLLALLPPDSPFFRLALDKFKKDEMGVEDASQVDKALSDIENSVMDYVEASPIRTNFFELLKHLLSSGNVLVHYDSHTEKCGLNVYGMDKYVVSRAPTGKLLKIILKELVVPEELEPEVRAACDIKDSDDLLKQTEMFTCVEWNNNVEMYYVKQVLNGHTVPDSKGTYSKDNLPWLALRLHKVDSESWGRGHGEEYLGDLITLEQLHRSIVVAANAAAKVVFLVNPNGVTKADDLNKATSGSFRTGTATDVSTIQMDKFADFRVALDTVARIEDRLSSAFMLREAVQRDAERVTAEEIRYMAGELDDSLGGIYSILAQELQLPLVKLVMRDMEKKKILPALPEDLVSPVITTGLDALGRTHDLIKLDNLVKDIFALSPEVAAKYVNISEYIKRRGAALKVDTENLIRTEDEVAEADNQAQRAQMIQQAVTPGINALSKSGALANAEMPQPPTGEQ